MKMTLPHFYYRAVFGTALRRPISKIINPTVAEAIIIKEVDKLPLLPIMPTPDDIIPPMPICIKPNSADAVPAFFEKGCNATAAALG